MKNPKCTSCKLTLPTKQVEYLRELKELIHNYYSDTIEDVDDDIEVIIRIDGTVIDLIKPSLFDLI